MVNTLLQMTESGTFFWRARVGPKDWDTVPSRGVQTASRLGVWVRVKLARTVVEEDCATADSVRSSARARGRLFAISGEVS